MVAKKKHSTTTDVSDSPATPKRQPKKRGRKPKGGKLISTSEMSVSTSVPLPNIVMHLRCRLSDLKKDTFLTPLANKDCAGSTSKDLNSFQFSSNVHHTLSGDDENKVIAPAGNDIVSKNISHKLQQLSKNLKGDTISATKSACFWCTCSFDNPPVYIPTGQFDGAYHCYGCFCSPECAVAHLFKEQIDNATRFERYSLLNYIYCEIYNHRTNIKPAPDPRYTLDKFYGNLSIQEYRKLLKNDQLLLVVNKPLTRILPELHEDSDDFILDSGTSALGGKYQLRRRPKLSKAQILGDKFNMHFSKQSSKNSSYGMEPNAAACV